MYQIYGVNYEQKLCLKFKFFCSKSSFFSFRYKFTIVRIRNRQTIKTVPEMLKQEKIKFEGFGKLSKNNPNFQMKMRRE